MRRKQLSLARLVSIPVTREWLFCCTGANGVHLTKLHLDDFQLIQAGPWDFPTKIGRGYCVIGSLFVTKYSEDTYKCCRLSWYFATMFLGSIDWSCWHQQLSKSPFYNLQCKLLRMGLDTLCDDFLPISHFHSIAVDAVLWDVFGMHYHAVLWRLPEPFRDLLALTGVADMLEDMIDSKLLWQTALIWPAGIDHQVLWGPCQRCLVMGFALPTTISYLGCTLLALMMHGWNISCSISRINLLLRREASYWSWDSVQGHKEGTWSMILWPFCLWLMLTTVLIQCKQVDQGKDFCSAFRHRLAVCSFVDRLLFTWWRFYRFWICRTEVFSRALWVWFPI